MLLCCAETMTIMPQLDVRSIGIQCNLLAVPPLKKLQCKVDITEESLMISLCSIAIVAYCIYIAIVAYMDFIMRYIIITMV